jgi:hypothetical protein
MATNYNMTLDQFCAEVKRAMQEKNIPLDTPIWYIDISFPQPGAIDVRNEGPGLAVLE